MLCEGSTERGEDKILSSPPPKMTFRELKNVNIFRGGECFAGGLQREGGKHCHPHLQQRRKRLKARRLRVEETPRT